MDNARKSATNKLSIKNRFTLVCLGLSFLISAFYILMIYTSIHNLETILAGKVLSAITDWHLEMVHNSPSVDQAVPLPTGILLYIHNTQIQNGSSNPIPMYFRGLSPGVHEIITDEADYLVRVEHKSNMEYVAALDQTDFESIEVQIYTIMIAASFLCVIIGGWTGRALSNLVISPINNLAGQVKHSNPNHSLEKLSAYYGDDVVGELASAFDQQSEQIRYFLLQEKLFTSDVSHELRTPLTIISGAADILSNQTDLSVKSLRTVNRIVTACADMMKLINAFLYLSRENDLTQSAEPVISINQIIAQCLAGIEEKASQQNITLTLKENSYLELNIKRELLTIVLDNLLRNAVSYNESGAVVVSIDNRTIKVADNGPGIPNEIVDQVFLRKGRVDANVARGNGMGLAIVKRICDLSHWKIELVTGPDQGTIFSISFS